MTFGGGKATTYVSRGSSASAAYSPSSSQVSCQRVSTPSGVYSGSIGGESRKESRRGPASTRCGAAGLPGTARNLSRCDAWSVRLAPGSCSFHGRRAGLRSPRSATRWSPRAGPDGTTEPVQRTTPVSTVSARVKFAFTSSVVQPDSGIDRRHEGEAHGRVHERHRQPGVHDPDRVVVELGGLALEHRVTVTRLDEPESERLGDRRRRKLAGGHHLHQLEARAPGHPPGQRERVFPGVRARALRRTRLATDRVALHSARIRRGLQQPVRLACNCRDAAERPRRPQRDLVPSPLEIGDDTRAEPRLERERLRREAARVEGRDQVVGVELRSVDRLLEIRARGRRDGGRRGAPTAPAGRRQAFPRRGTACRRGVRAPGRASSAAVRPA